MFGVFLLSTLVGCSGANISQTSDEPLTQVYEIPLPEKLRYELTNDLGEQIGLGVFQSEIDSTDSSIIMLEERYSRADNSDAGDIIMTRVSAADFSAIGGLRDVEKVSELEIQSFSYSWKIVQIAGEKRVLQKTDKLADSGIVKTKKLPDLKIYANSSSFWLWRQLPLEIGYAASYLSVDPFEEKWQLVTITVPQSEVLKMPFGDIPVWRVLIRSGRATRSAWIEQSQPHRVLKWDNGLTVMTLID